MPNTLPIAWLIDLEWMPGWKAALIFLALAAPIVLLGMRSLAGLGPVRQWVSIAFRLLVLLTLVLIIGGARWKREHKSLDLMVLRDNSRSVDQFRGFVGKNITDAVDDFLTRAAEDARKKHKDDRIGVISFDRTPLIDSMPHTSIILDARAIREKGSGTDIASAIQLALATFQRDAMRRILLVSDGNQTAGDIESAIAAAVSQNVPIDIMKLTYSVKNEVLVDRISAPSWRKEGEAFDVFVSLVSTNTEPVSGTLTVTEDGQRIEEPRRVTIPPADLKPDGKVEPRKHIERIRVSAARVRTVRSFKAMFEADVVNSGVTASGANAGATDAQQARPGDTLLENNTASAFTFVQGQGRILYVDNTRNGAGNTLASLLLNERFNLERATVGQVPEDLVKLQDYDAIILNNVPRGRTGAGGDGLGQKHDEALASYVHDFGGGLIMIGGPDSFGAGGWQGSKIEEVLPVNMDIPAQRQMPKGALVLIIHSCEMPNGNYWGEQCAIKAIETLSSRDDIGVIAYNWGGNVAGGVGGAHWVYPLGPKGDGTKVIAAIKKMKVGDMPSFDDSVQLAVHGAGPGQVSLLTNDAAQKHIIAISDGDPAAPKNTLMQTMVDSKITVSTVSVYPHGNFVPPTMQQMAKVTGGRYYGPVENNPGQLPQIFIKEATVVRRTLLQEQRDPPLSVQLIPTGSDVMKNITQPPPIYGMVLTNPKQNPTIDIPLKTVNKDNKVDPLFAHWQAGLGKSAAFTSDAANLWMEPWLASAQTQGQYGRLFSNMVRYVSRPPMSRDFSVSTVRQGDKAVVMIEATNKEGGFTGALSINGKVMDPEGKQRDIRAVQTGPGTYTAEFPISNEGNYVVALSYSGQDGKTGWLVSGLPVNDSPETRELKSNDALMQSIATRTGGRVIPAFDPAAADLFSRQNIKVTTSPLPVWDLLLPVLLALILLDVACRRIAWDWQSTKKMAAAVASKVRSFTLVRQVEAKPTLDALRRVREEVAETRFRTGESAAPTGAAPPPVPNRSAKFEAAKGVEGDLTSVVGGATDKAIPSAPKDPKPKGAPPAPGGHTGSLLEAKRRAQQQIKQKEQGE